MTVEDIKTKKINLQEIKELVVSVFQNQGCDLPNANALAKTIVSAERDGSSSHGLFRVPGYVASLQSGKVNGKASPKMKYQTPVILKCNADNGFASYAHEIALPMLIDAAKINGIAALSITGCYHFAALWPETEFLANENLVGLACTAFNPGKSSFKSIKPFFGTNPISMAWPYPGKNPVVFDMATASMAKGEVSIAARDGYTLPDGVGLDGDGNPSNDPKEILKGVLLPFGGYKGSAISLMVELFAAGLTGDTFLMKLKRMIITMVALQVVENLLWPSILKLWQVLIGQIIASYFLINYLHLKE